MIRTPIKKVSAQYRIPKRSKKMQKTIRDQKKMYVEHEKEGGGPGECRGCGRWRRVVDNSHMLSQGQFKRYRNEPWNVTAHSSECCHNLWESHTERWKLQDFKENMLILRENAPEAYAELIGLMQLKMWQYRRGEWEQFIEAIQSLEN